jgi:hypothetical protein
MAKRFSVRQTCEGFRWPAETAGERGMGGWALFCVRFRRLHRGRGGDGLHNEERIHG